VQINVVVSSSVYCKVTLKVGCKFIDELTTTFQAEIVIKCIITDQKFKKIENNKLYHDFML